MAPDQPSNIPARALQEYLETLVESSAFAPAERQERLLRSYAELQFQLKGGSRCAVCAATVRHVLPVRAERADGVVLEYSCLCNRCLQGEHRLARRVILGSGRAQVAYESAELVDLPAPGEMN